MNLQCQSAVIQEENKTNNKDSNDYQIMQKKCAHLQKLLNLIIKEFVYKRIKDVMVEIRIIIMNAMVHIKIIVH